MAGVKILNLLLAIEYAPFFHAPALSEGASVYDNLSEDMSEHLRSATNASIEGLNVLFGARPPSARSRVTQAQKAVHEHTIDKVMQQRASLPARIEAA